MQICKYIYRYIYQELKCSNLHICILQIEANHYMFIGLHVQLHVNKCHLPVHIFSTTNVGSRLQQLRSRQHWQSPVQKKLWLGWSLCPRSCMERRCSCSTCIAKALIWMRWCHFVYVLVPLQRETRHQCFLEETSPWATLLALLRLLVLSHRQSLWV